MTPERWKQIVDCVQNFDDVEEGREGGVPYSIFRDLYNEYRQDQMRVRVGVAVVIPRTDGKVLMGKRKGSRGAGTWHLIGGHMEYGETVEMCALRETLEETGIILHHVVAGRYVDNLFTEDGRHYVTLYVVAPKSNYPDPTLCEPEKCEEWIWADPQDLPSPLFPPLERYLKKYTLGD